MDGLFSPNVRVLNEPRYFASPILTNMVGLIFDSKDFRENRSHLWPFLCPTSPERRSLHRDLARLHGFGFRQRNSQDAIVNFGTYFRRID